MFNCYNFCLVLLRFVIETISLRFVFLRDVISLIDKKAKRDNSYQGPIGLGQNKNKIIFISFYRSVH